MTEDEAKTKWCPFVRFTGTPSDDLVPNRSEGCEDTTRCIASACMAWKESGCHSQDKKGNHVFTPNGHGYCGLASR